MALSTTREALHRLIDGLPGDVLDDAARYLKALSTDDPVLRAALLAPEDDEGETEEEQQAWAEAEADIAGGRLLPDAEVRRRILGAS
jgi:hypothetical protein